MPASPEVDLRRGHPLLGWRAAVAETGTPPPCRQPNDAKSRAGRTQHKALRHPQLATEPQDRAVFGGFTAVPAFFDGLQEDLKRTFRVEMLDVQLLNELDGKRLAHRS